MFVIKVKDILKITKGELIIGNPEETCEKYAKDSREVQEGDIYIGIKGEKVNGSQYYEKAFENGAKGCIIQEIEIGETEKQKYKNKTIIKVEDTTKALQQIASYKRSKYNIPVIAITGSVGKTSTKDIVANVVNQKYKTLKTIGNYNNHIGMPLTILNKCTYTNSKTNNSSNNKCRNSTHRKSRFKRKHTKSEARNNRRIARRRQNSNKQ